MDRNTVPKLKKLLSKANTKRGVMELAVYLQKQIETDDDYDIAWDELCKIECPAYFNFAAESVHYLIGVTDEIPCFIDDEIEVEGRTWLQLRKNFPSIEEYAEQRGVSLDDDDVITEKVYKRFKSFILKELARRKDEVGTPIHISESVMGKKYSYHKGKHRASRGREGNYFKLIYGSPRS